MKQVSIIIILIWSICPNGFSQITQGMQPAQMIDVQPYSMDTDAMARNLRARENARRRSEENSKAELCAGLMQYVKTNGYGVAYNSYNSDAISKVTFYTMTVDYENHYFAIVCFKRKYSSGCQEYLYRVASDTKSKYAQSYISSAGQAFWNYIEPYSDALGCSPDFD